MQFNADLFRNEVVKVYQSFRPMTKEEIRGSVVRGQYTESQWRGSITELIVRRTRSPLIAVRRPS